MHFGQNSVRNTDITASVFINDNESGLHNDYDKWLEGLAPRAPTRQYLHNRTGDAGSEGATGQYRPIFDICSLMRYDETTMYCGRK